MAGRLSDWVGEPVSRRRMPLFAYIGSRLEQHRCDRSGTRLVRSQDLLARSDLVPGNRVSNPIHEESRILIKPGLDPVSICGAQLFTCPVLTALTLEVLEGSQIDSRQLGADVR
jgi:hypothetical protein